MKRIYQIMAAALVALTPTVAPAGVLQHNAVKGNVRGADRVVATLPNGKHIRLKRVNLDERTGLSSKGCDMKKAAERMVRGASIVASPKMTAAGSGVQGAAVAAPKASATTYRNPNDLMTMLNNGACYINGVSTQAESLVTFHDDYCYTQSSPTSRETPWTR